MNINLFETSYSPVQLLDDDLSNLYEVKVYVKRDDLIHPSVQGNKWRKLKYNILKIKEQNISTLLTVGGAFSNHIYATAAAGHLFDIDTIGIIRGERTDPLSNTLIFAENHGMRLHFIRRNEYRDKTMLMDALKLRFGDVYILPEGGTNELAVHGCSEIVEEVNQQLISPPDFLTVACGTGGTLTGIIKAADRRQTIIGFAVLKGGFIANEVSNLIDPFRNPAFSEKINDESLKINDGIQKDYCNWSINSDYHFGGYTKWSIELIEFINDFKFLHGIALDPIYTGKMFFGLYDLIKKGYFPRGSTILAVHTGGLQGVEGFNAVKLRKSPIKIL